MILHGQKFPRMYAPATYHPIMPRTPKEIEEGKKTEDVALIYTIAEDRKTIKGMDAYGDMDEAEEEAWKLKSKNPDKRYGVQIWKCSWLDPETECYTYAEPVRYEGLTPCD